MSAVTPLRILVCGHVNGNISRLFDRVCALSKKAAFDALLVAGDLFPASESDAPVDMSWMQHLVDDDDVYLHLPSSIFVFGPRTECQRMYYRQMMRLTTPEETDDEDELMRKGFDALNGKVTVLGNRGIITCSSGLTVAYYTETLDGKSSDKDLEQFITTINSSASEVDIFLAPVWPKDVHTASTVTIPDPIVKRSASGSDLISRLTYRLKPRYLFSASDPGPDSEVGVYFERQPFRNHTVLKGPLRPVTRFISLATVSGEKKGPKWLYAFHIKAGSDLHKHDKESGRNEGRIELNQQPDDTTESPFKDMDLHYTGSGDRSRKQNEVQFFYQVGRDKRQRVEQGNNNHQAHQADQEERGKRQRRAELDPEQCWFCLASPHVEKEFVVSIADNAYLATAKGGLVEEHLLILPIEHIRSSLDTDDAAISDIHKFKEALGRYFASRGQIVAFFERNFKSQHMQVQVVPLPEDCVQEAEQVKQAMTGVIRGHGLHYTMIPAELTLRDVVNTGLPYLHMEVPAIGWQVVVHINTRRRNEDGSSLMFPMQLGREVLAHVLHLDPCTSHWKNVLLSKDQEAARAIRFRSQFRDFDFTIDDE